MNNLFDRIIESPYLDVVGWSLLHSVWQAMAVALVLWLFLKFTEGYLSAGYRYIVAAFSLLVVVFWTGVSVFNGITLRSGQEAASGSSIYLALNDVDKFIAKNVSWVEIGLDQINRNLVFFLIFWVIGVSIFLIRIFGGLLYLEKIRNSAWEIEDWIAGQAQRIAGKFNITRKFRIVQSGWVSIPSVVGHFKPLIIFPAGMMSGLTLNELNNLLAHELAHIRRNDYLVNILQSITEAFYFFNPFVWWISKMIRDEREHACDEMALSCLGDPGSYAETLVKITEIESLKKPALSPGISGGRKSFLMKRIQRIMTGKKINPNGWLSALVIITILAVPAYLIAGDSMVNNTYEGDKGVITEEIGAALAAIENKNEINEALVSGSNKPYGDTIPDELDPEPEVENEIDVEMDVEADTEVENENEEGPEIDMDMDIDLGYVPQIDRDLPPPPPVFLHRTDTLPYDWDEDEWLDFSNEFQEEMEEFNEHMKKLEEELRLHFEFDFQEWEEVHKEQMEKMREQLEENMDLMETERMLEIQEKMMQEFDEEWRDEFESKMRELEEKMENLPDIREDLEEMESRLEEEMKHLEEFEDELKDMLVEDGYISAGEDVDIEFDGDEIRVNGTKVKDKDKEKYLELRRKYFPRDDGRFRYRNG